MRATKVCAALCALIFLAGLAGTAWVLRPPAQSLVVEIVQDGRVLHTIDLSALEGEQTLEILWGEFSNTLLMSREGIQVVEANCADQTCVHMGPLRSRALPIVCLPHRLVIRYAQPSLPLEEEPLDAIVG